MTKKFRFMTRLLAVVLAVVMLSSAIYLAVEANHDCSGDDCAILPPDQHLREFAEISGACRCCRSDHCCVYIYHVQGDPALRRDDRHTDTRFSQGKAFELKTGLLQGRSLSVFG